ncbi:hypothetical protein KA093_00035 [Candidatus Saccharibacteria bacterium]|nr:hypothetical protein [Candidatus Saccharibacteria bacterium]
MPIGSVFRGAVLGLLLVFLCTDLAAAQSQSSNNYRFDESTVGAGGLLQSSSNNYMGTSAFGDIGVGTSLSNNFQFSSGSKTSPDPTLSFAILSSVANFGTFTASSTTTATASFMVANYTTYGYVVQMYGSTPTHNSHSIDAMSATNTSQAGVEQFGINLVANTSPASFGANPNNGQFGYGSVMSNYATPDNYRYVSGETIAHATKNSGVTVYTISYIVNVAPLTPGGSYTADQTLIVTGTY